MAENERVQSLPFGHFIKSLRDAVNLGQMAMKQACRNFFRSTLAETKGFCSYFRVPSNGKNALSCGKPDRNGRNRASARSTLRPFYKEFQRGRKIGSNGIETGVQ